MSNSLKYKKEHLSCGYYQKGNGAIIEFLRLQKGEELRTEIAEPKIVFIQKGKGCISYHKILDQVVEQNQIVLLPPLSNLYVKTEEDTFALVFKLDSTVKLCNTYSLENLYDDAKKQSEGCCLLNVNDRLHRYLDLLTDCINDGIRCSNYLDIKTKELMYYLRIYYTKKELSQFFAPILTNDSLFANFVYQNYKKAKTVQQLSDLYGYSQSSFEKQFKKVFGISAYQWMVDRKAKEVYHRLTCSDKTFMDIVVEYDFSSSSQFCDFCKHFLGASPKEIRQKRICKI